MSELKAFRDVDLTAFERELFAAARSDRMPAELSLRVSGALSTSSAAPASTSAAAQGGVWFGKSVWGVLTLVVLVGSGAFFATTEAKRAPAPIAVVAPQPAVATVAEPATSALPIQAPAVAPTARAPALPDVEALRQEVRLLDRARVALDRSAADQALALLAQHAARFPNGTLLPEAEALRIEALALSGEGEQAQARLASFLRAHPEHPMSERLRALASR